MGGRGSWGRPPSRMKTSWVSSKVRIPCSAMVVVIPGPRPTSGMTVTPARLAASCNFSSCRDDVGVAAEVDEVNFGRHRRLGELEVEKIGGRN